MLVVHTAMIFYIIHPSQMEWIQLNQAQVRLIWLVAKRAGVSQDSDIFDCTSSCQRIYYCTLVYIVLLNMICRYIYIRYDILYYIYLHNFTCSIMIYNYI